MTATSGRRRARWRGRRPAGDTGSVALALLLTLVGVTLSALLVPMVVTQLGAARAAAARADELNAAQAGLDAALGWIRTATVQGGSGASTGDITKLPCGPVAGPALPGNTATYTVRITYLTDDPHGKTGDQDWITHHQIRCTRALGVATAPAYALLSSAGQGPAGAAKPRTLTSTYRFQVVHQPIRGGLVHVTGTGLCLDAGSAAPASGTDLRVQPCGPDSPQQRFAYGKNLNVYLAATRTPDALGMCLDAGTPQHAGSPVRFEPCASTTQPRQQWFFNDAANFQGTRNGAKPDNFCFAVTGTEPGSPVVLRPCPQGTGLAPEPFVGVGTAGPSSQQVMNLSQFGRCMDVTEFGSNKAFLTASPCEQAADPADTGWNQKWRLPEFPPNATSATGPISTDNGAYCLFSPGVTAPFQYVTVKPCSAGPQLWTVYHDTGDDLTGYHIQDSQGHCLSPTDPDATPPDLYTDPNGYQVSKIVVADCDRSARQRWNSPPLNAALEDLSEK